MYVLPCIKFVKLYLIMSSSKSKERSKNGMSPIMKGRVVANDFGFGAEDEKKTDAKPVHQTHFEIYKLHFKLEQRCFCL